MSDSARVLNLVLCWHMHQPDYRDYVGGDFVLPWTYLHAAKDYTDMAYHLEQNPKARAVLNFVPVLLDQLEDYTEQFKSGEIRDPLLRLLAREDMRDLTVDERTLLLDRCFRANHVTMIEPYPAYRHLLTLFQGLDQHDGKHFEYLSGQYLADLVTWYHLIWTGESVRRNYELVPRLMSQGSGFSYTDRRLLFELYGELISGVIPRYKKLQDEGRIEISATPYYHPLAPLLIDLKSAHQAMPGCSLPEASNYPGGQERVAFHIDAALASHEARFGRRPGGMWPAEGGVSQPLFKLMARHGVNWAATGEGVLVNSIRASHGSVPDKPHYMYRPYLVGEGEERMSCFFRDDRMSDLIGFEYAKWYGRDAVAHFVHELEDIYRNTSEHESPIVSIILDGENAWEYYPYNAYYFLMEVYEALADHPFIRLTTYSDYLAHCGTGDGKQTCAAAGNLPQIVAGSWVYGNFATWIGSPDKNRAWDLLCAAKQSYDHVIGSGRLSAEECAAAARQLADCESSDWCWWFGDYNPALSVATFDQLYRENLANLYKLLHLPVPEVLSHPVSYGGATGAEASGAMRRAS